MTIAAEPRLESLVSWQLAVAGRLIRSRADAHPAFQTAGAQPTGVLIRLLEEDGLTQVALARLQRIEAPTLCRMVDRLEREGLVERRAHPQDRRAVRVHLTPAGRRAARRGRKGIPQVEEAVLRDLDEDEQRRLGELLSRILDALGSEAGA